MVPLARHCKPTSLCRPHGQIGVSFPPRGSPHPCPGRSHGAVFPIPLCQLMEAPQSSPCQTSPSTAFCASGRTGSPPLTPGGCSPCPTLAPRETLPPEDAANLHMPIGPLSHPPPAASPSSLRNLPDQVSAGTVLLLSTSEKQGTAHQKVTHVILPLSDPTSHLD